MRVSWIIENFTKEKSYEELAVAVRKQGFPLLEIKGDYKDSMLDSFRTSIGYSSRGIEPQHCIIFNGSIEMAKLIQRSLSPLICKPVVYSNFSNYLCSKYYSYFGGWLFNDKYAIISLSELQRQKLFFYGIFGKEGIIFVRPNSGEKEFQAQLLDIIDFNNFFDQNKHLMHELVVISTPKNILSESRFIVNKHKEIIAYSLYRFQGQKTLIPTVPPECIDFCKRVLEVGYFPDSVFCIDLCQDNDRNVYLMELNSFSSAGLYECNKDDIVNKISKQAWEDFNNK